MKYFRGHLTIPATTAIHSTDKWTSAHGTYEASAFIAAKTKKRAMELIGVTSTYWFNQVWKQTDKHNTLPDGEGVWWTMAYEKYYTKESWDSYNVNEISEIFKKGYGY